MNTLMQETNQSPSSEIKCHTLLIEDQASFIYPEGGRCIICRCLTALVIRQGLTSDEIYRKIYLHLYREHLKKDVDRTFTITSVSPEIRNCIREFVKEIEPKIKMSKLKGVPCEILNEFGLETCPPGYKVDGIKWCFNCGTSVSKHAAGDRVKCCKVSSLCECPGLVTHQGDQGKRRHGMALVTGFPNSQIMYNLQ
jgi:hypothetical protein